MLKYLNKLFGVPDLKIYELSKDERSSLAIQTRSSKGVGFSVPPHYFALCMTVKNFHTKKKE